MSDDRPIFLSLILGIPLLPITIVSFALVTDHDDNLNTTEATILGTFIAAVAALQIIDQIRLRRWHRSRRRT